MSDGWLVNLGPGGDAGRVLCFPHACGGPTAFRDWPGLLPPGVRVDAVALPGREHRLGEVPPRSLLISARHIAAELVDCGTPQVFFGHSLGAMLAFETARRLRALGAPLPRHLIVSGARPPQMPRATTIHARPDEDLLAELRRLKATPEEVLRAGEVMEALLPTVRADFTAVETYAYVPEPPLELTLTALGGVHDPDVTAAHLRAWRAHAEVFAGYRQLAGDHFYLLGDAQPAVVRTVAEAVGDQGTREVRDGLRSD
jgi:medium-chain acyl-[acyl-carrier-protein] hydrolase